MGFEAHLIHVVNVALNSQIRSLGEQRVLDVKARQLRHGIIKVSKPHLPQDTVQSLPVGTLSSWHSALLVRHLL
eukprot:1438195-Pleurochrysis_carterae.AAC.4